MPGRCLIRTFRRIHWSYVDGEREDRVAGVGSFVMLSGPCAPAGRPSQRLRKFLTARAPRFMGAGRSSNRSSAAGVANESEVAASGDMAHA
jgi:hypothetical protein